MPIEFRADANVPLVVIEVGQRGLLNFEQAAVAAKGILASRETYPAAKIVLSVAGYDDDGRELWDVPEVVDYLLEVFDLVFTEWTEGSIDDLNLDDASTALVLVCTGALRPIGRDPKSGNYLFAPGDEASGN